jgi:hypothetical protein
MLPIPYGGMLCEVRGQAEAKAVPGVVELTITAEPGDELVPLPEGRATWGFSPRERHRRTEQSLRDAHRRLTVVISASPPTATNSSSSSPLSQAMSF